MGVFSAHVPHDLDAKTVELSAQRMVQGRWRFIQVNSNTFLSVLVARMANIWLPPCTSSTTECLQWWAFTPVKRHPLQDYFGPEMGGGGLYLTLYGINKYSAHSCFS